MVVNIFLLFNLLVFQQQEIIVLDENSKKPLELVHLSFYRNGLIFHTNVTNEKGMFLPHFEYDSLQASILGYKSKIVKYDANHKMVIKLAETILNIDEVILSNSKKTKIIGDWDTKGKKEKGFYTKEVYAIKIENEVNKSYKPISLLVNFKEVPKKASVAFKFYTILNVNRKYFDQIDKEFFYLDIKIPNKDGLIGTLEFELLKNTTGIYEFDLSDLNFELPKEGFFVSPVTLKIFDDDGAIIKNPTNEMIPVIYSHKTDQNNICEMRKFKGENYWENNVQLSKYHDEKIFVLFPSKYFSPSIALKTEVLIN